MKEALESVAYVVLMEFLIEDTAFSVPVFVPNKMRNSKGIRGVLGRDGTEGR